MSMGKKTETIRHGLWHGDMASRLPGDKSVCFCDRDWRGMLTKGFTGPARHEVNGWTATLRHLVACGQGETKETAKEPPARRLEGHWSVLWSMGLHGRFMSVRFNWFYIWLKIDLYSCVSSLGAPNTKLAARKVRPLPKPVAAPGAINLEDGLKMS